MLYQLILIRISIKEESSICANVIFCPCSDWRYENSQEILLKNTLKYMEKLFFPSQI